MGHERSAERIVRKGAWSLYSKSDKQWANGVIHPSGSDYMPLWGDREACVRWAPDWPGYAAKRISAVELARRAILEKLHLDLYWVGLGLGRDTLVMAHPAWLMAQLPSG